MKINVHAHVFNFRSILTKETILLLKHRLTGLNIPAPFRDVILSYLRTRRRRKTSDLSLDDFYRTIRGLGAFNILVPRPVRNLFDHHLEISSSIEGEQMLMSLLESALVDRGSVSSSSVINIFDWLRIGLMKNINDVTDDLMTHMDDDDVAVLLPMDIIDRKAGKKERSLFIKQLEDTEKQALRYPGRMLPFAMVNPVRNNSFEIFKKSIDSGACVGLKLYPSLGYSIEHATVQKALKYCNDQSVPVLLHGNDKGFRKSKKDAAFCNPKYWVPVLDELKNLKVCFGHFGGETQDGKETWTKAIIPDDSWALAILRLMENYPGRVFGDLSFHTDHWEDETKGENYLNNIKNVLKDDRYKTQVLWGTDFHLLRMASTDRDFTQKFHEMLGEIDFNRIANENPVHFLGLPATGKKEEKNISRHVEWLIENKASTVYGTPASWLLEHERVDREAFNNWILSASGSWSINNLVHRSLFQFFWTPQDVPEYLHAGARKSINNQFATIEEKFEAIGMLSLAELTYFSHGPASPVLDNQKMRGFCKDIMFWFRRKTNAEHIGPQDDNILYSKLQQTAGQSDKRISDIAGIVSGFFRFPVI